MIVLRNLRKFLIIGALWKFITYDVCLLSKSFLFHLTLGFKSLNLQKMYSKIKEIILFPLRTGVMETMGNNFK